MKIAKFNDTLALILVIALISLWVVDPFFRWKYGFGLPDQVIGASIGLIAYPVMYYFRKKEGEKPEGS